MKPALLVIDVQKTFFARDPGTAQSLDVGNGFVPRVDTLVITGFRAEYCVLSTCRGALEPKEVPRP